MEGVTDVEMNEFVKLNPEYAKEFYNQLKTKYTDEETSNNAKSGCSV